MARKRIEDFKMYKQRIRFMIDNCKIDKNHFGKFLGCRWRAVINNMPQENTIQLIAQYFDVSVDFIRCKQLESYSAKEVEILLQFENLKIEKELRKIKTEITKYFQQKLKEYCE